MSARKALLAALSSRTATARVHAEYLLDAYEEEIRAAERASIIAACHVDPEFLALPGRDHPSYRTADALRAKPGEWARIATYPRSRRTAASSRAASVRTALVKAYAPRGSFDAVERTEADEIHVYACYVGAPS